MEVKLFIPCVMRQFFPESAQRVEKILKKTCGSIETLPFLCCGQADFQMGDWKSARKKAQKFLDFQGDYLVLPSGACVAFLREHLGKVLAPEEMHYWDRLSHKVLEMSEFLVDVLDWQDWSFVEAEGNIAYHDACQAYRVCGIANSPRKLLSAIPRIRLVELNMAKNCCGFGGALSQNANALSEELSARIIDEMAGMEIDYIVSSDMACLLHLKKYIQKYQKSMQIKHLADILGAEL